MRVWNCSASAGLLLGAVALIQAVVLSPVTADDSKLDYNKHVRPILSDACFKCHGFDEKTRAAGLRLDTAEGAAAKLESGSVAIIAGKSGESELLRRITSADDTERMPPTDSGKTLTAAQIEILRRWIDEGAEYKPHWSFIAPQRPTPPALSDGSGALNPIDNFIIARLAQDGLKLSPAADKAALLRRVTFDLTGLPPAPAEIDAFLADESPEAYAKVVDRLLKSPRYGEHMARYWLDAARYGDTHGLHLDNERSLWPYRDWVIDAFNRNLPFDQFTVWQIAGDLLPNSTLEQRVASGFNRCNVTTSEGGSIDDEVRVRYAVDRTETMSTVFLGLTLGCAVCHDHKFDPVTQKEFYQLFAFYNSAADAAMDGNALAPPPILKLASPEQESQLKAFDEQIAALRKNMADELAKVEYTDPTPDGAAVAAAAEAKEYVWVDDAAPPGASLQGNTPWQFVNSTEGQVYSGEKATARKGDGVVQHFFTGANPPLKVGDGDKLFAYCWLDPANPPKTVMLQWNDGQWEHRAYWGEDAINFGVGDVPGHRHMGSLPELGKWVRLEVDAAQVGLPAGTMVNGLAFTQFGGSTYWDKAGSVTRTLQDGQSFDSLAAWEAFEKAQAKSAIPADVLAAVKVEKATRTEDQQKLIRNYFLENVFAKTKPTFDGFRQQIADADKKKKDFDAAIPMSLVMADMPTPRDTFILVRGAYDKHGEKVTPATPAALPPMPADAPNNRLGLAKWLVDPAHPLTSRVAVNRFWQQYFGVGLVKTADDFGAQGQWPSHPELLDWLAREFIETGWDVKGLQRTIVMSATYRQSSRVTPELLQRDPENLLLTRGPRHRLDAESLRDSALLLGGLLIEKEGGKGVRPYQPEGIWEAVAFQGSTTQNYTQDKGEALYRRSLYLFWKRTAPPPTMMAFDAPSRESCVVRRSRTNTPLQALVLMNDKQFVEAARSMAQRVVLEGGATPVERLTYAFRLATGRKPADHELPVLEKVFGSHLADYQADKAAAEQLVSVGESPRNAELDAAELASYTMVCNLILNLDEVVTKE
jgi:hypothetical protein